MSLRYITEFNIHHKQAQNLLNSLRKLLRVDEKKIQILQPQCNSGRRKKPWLRVEPLLHFADDTDGWSYEMWMCWDQTAVCSCCERQCPARRLFCSVAHFVCLFLRGTGLSNQSPRPETEWAIMFQSDFHSAMRTVKRRGAPHRDDYMQRKQHDFQHCKNNSAQHTRPSQCCCSMWTLPSIAYFAGQLMPNFFSTILILTTPIDQYIILYKILYKI